MVHGEGRGVATVYFLLFSFVIFGLLVMATDVGRFYLIQGELQTAADAAALAAATQLIGTGNARERGDNQLNASFDSSTGNDNRFNLRMNQLGASGGSTLVTSMDWDYFPMLADAQSNSNGGLTGGIDWGSGFYPKYIRVGITAEAPVMFAPLLTRELTRPSIAVSAVAGVSGPICSACGIEGFAVADRSAGEDTLHYGFEPGIFYTLFLVSTQRTGGPVTPAPLLNTSASVPYVVLNHVPNGPAELDVDGTLFEFGAGGLSASPGLSIPASVTIDSAETAYTVTGTTSAGQDILCGLNVRFGVPPLENNCANLGGGQFPALAQLYSADADAGVGMFTAGEGLQDFASEYRAALTEDDGRLRRVLTVAIVDAADSLTVLNFRQFLIQMSPVSPAVSQGLNTTLITGAFRAQYIGAPVPLRCGGIGGLCRVSLGVGRTVLH
jgi:hypothetical protein